MKPKTLDSTNPLKNSKIKQNETKHTDDNIQNKRKQHKYLTNTQK